MRLVDELTRVWQYIRLLILISWFHLFKLMGNVIDRREGVIEQHIAKLMSRRILEVLRASVHVEGEEHMRNLEDYAVVANHLSYLDWVVVLAHMPKPVCFIAKRIVVLMPVFGSYMRNRGVLIDRRKHQNARAIIRNASRATEHPLMIFPEGTRSPDGKLQKFKRAGIRTLADEGLKLLPVVLLGTFEALGRDDRAIRYRKHLGLIILPPIDPAELGSAEACRELERVIHETYELRRHEFGGPAQLERLHSRRRRLRTMG